MDFLDPKAKKRRTLQLFAGYGLMATLISIITLILVFQAYGFDVDRKTGEVIQNGLIFVDSAPDKARVFINSQEQRDQTNNRYSLPSGQYDMKIRKDGYKDWQRQFTLEGGEVERFTYPLLIPNSLAPTEILTLDVAPTFVTGSPDRRWVVTNQADSLANFVEYDLNNLTNNIPASRPFVIPANVFTPSQGAQTIELVEWSNDNKHMLVKHNFGGRNEFVVLSRDQPTTSININALTGVNPTTVTLQDKKFDKWYLYTQQGGILQFADTKNAVSQVLTGVTSYKSHDQDTLLYSTLINDGKTQRVTLKQGNDSYIIKDVANGAVFLDIARYDGSWYTIIGSDAEQRTFIYRDPVTVLQKKDGSKPTPRSILKATSPISYVGFSQNTRFTVMQSGQHFEVYDAEANQIFKYDLSNAIDVSSKVIWMDGHRMLVRSGAKTIMFDFDGSNKQELVSSLPQAPTLFDRDFTVLYSVNSSNAAPGKFSLFSTQLRLDGDK